MGAIAKQLAGDHKGERALGNTCNTSQASTDTNSE